jgi:hypothetical protein
MYVVAIVIAIATVGALLSVAFRGPGDVQAILVSGVLALAAQLLAFGLGRLAAGTTPNVTVRIGTGALVRMFFLFAFALLLAAKVVALPLVAALVSFATFVFLSSLIEPLLIK